MISMAYSTCGQSLGIVSGFYSKNEGDRALSMSGQWKFPDMSLSCFSFSIDEAFVQFKYY